MKTSKMSNEIVQVSILPDVSFTCKPHKHGIVKLNFVILFLFIFCLLCCSTFIRI
jgi:hypothetical protein